MIESFLREMQERYGEQIEAVDLPEGTQEYVEGRIRAGDAATLLFMLKLGYLMGVQTGFAAGRAGDDRPEGGGPMGPMQA